jgi:predicted nucleic acid-binding protein
LKNALPATEEDSVRVFFDSSAFVKRYVSEPGTEAVLHWCDRATEIGLSAIELPEIVSAFCRLRREDKIDETRYRQLKSLLLADIEDAAICDLTPAVLAQSITSLETNVLRGMDAIHIGSAVLLKADVFISADQRQRDAALRAGLQVDVV